MTLISNLEYDRMRDERDEARAIARQANKALKRVRDGWGEPWQQIVCDAIDAIDAQPWAKEQNTAPDRRS